MTQQTQSQQAIQVREREPLPFVPTNVEQAWRTSELLSKSALLPDALRGKPHDVLVAVMTGAELGISPMISTREIYVVKGRPFIASLLRVAIVRQSPECLAWQLVESTDQRATYLTQRRGDAKPTTMSYTIREAEQSGLLAQNPKYRTDPALMLRRRCAGRLIDEVYPDIIRGVGAREDAEEDVQPAVQSLPIRIASTSAPPAPEPRQVEEAQEVTPPPSPALQVEEQPQEQQESASEPTAEEVLLAEVDGVSSIRDLDALTIRAKQLPQGPGRQAVGKAINARRAALKGDA